MRCNLVFERDIYLQVKPKRAVFVITFTVSFEEKHQLIEKLDFYITSKEYRSRSILFVTSGVVDGCQGVAMGLLGVCFTKFKKSPPTNL